MLFDKDVIKCGFTKIMIETEEPEINLWWLMCRLFQYVNDFHREIYNLTNKIPLDAGKCGFVKLSIEIEAPEIKSFGVDRDTEVLKIASCRKLGTWGEG